jgi:hypothetical protein
MKICLVGPGIMSIPPVGWGAVESLIWDYNLELKKLGHDVIIINISDTEEIINQVNSIDYDFVHIHYDVFYHIIPRLKCKNIAISSHYPYVDQYEKHIYDGYQNIFRYLCNNKYFYLFCISKKDMKSFLDNGAIPERTFLLENGANSNHFRFDSNCKLKDKSIYLGKIEQRKRQYLFQSIPNIDFVGKYGNTNFDTSNKNYLGEITPRETLFDMLTDYANLVLLSNGENGSPLVVKEAFCAGLGVVVSEFAASELDKDKPFITVIPESKINDIEYISNQISINREVSINMRDDIKNYFNENFSWQELALKYADNIKNITNK